MRGHLPSQVRSGEAAADPLPSGPARPPACGMPDSAACALRVLAEARQCGLPPPPRVLASCVRSLAKTRDPPAGILAPWGTPVARGRLLAAVPLEDSTRARLRELAIWTELGQWHKSARSYASAVEVWGLACCAAREPPWPPKEGSLDIMVVICRCAGSLVQYVSRVRSVLALIRGDAGALAHTGGLSRGALKRAARDGGRYKSRATAVQARSLGSRSVPPARRVGCSEVRDLAQWARSEAGREDIAGAPARPLRRQRGWALGRRRRAARQMLSSSPASSAYDSARNWWGSMPWVTRPSWRAHPEGAVTPQGRGARGNGAAGMHRERHPQGMHRAG